MIWDHNANVETPLPDMPHGVVRVYPASGATAMLPLTPDNDYNPTILFCGGSDMPEYAYGNYSFPFIDTFYYPASKDCQRITPEPKDGSAPAYEQDDDMLESRTMGQFIVLPDLKLLVVNGGLNGTAGYSQATGETTSYSLMPYGESLAAGPVGTPAIYDPKAPKGQRWSDAGLATSDIARLYHSSAILLPDASILIAGSNPNVDVNTSTIYPTTYQAEIFYPPYFSAGTRPQPSGMPKQLTYGGNPFDITIPPTSYSGSSNDAAAGAMVTLIRGGFTTHAMNMGQRGMQLRNSFTVKQDGTIILHVAQPPPNPYIYQPGPAFLYTLINGIPSNGSYVILGNGQIGQQPTAEDSTLPDSVRADGAKGAGSPNSNVNDGSDTSGSHKGAIIGGVVAAIVGIAVVGLVLGVFFIRRKKSAPNASNGYNMGGPSSMAAAASSEQLMVASGPGSNGAGFRGSDSSAFLPFKESSTFRDSEDMHQNQMGPPAMHNPYR